ncbi:MAG: hypothetical protein OXG40_01065 [Acidimicrobiaceae bacterium]|nr:hypothetical protein [Acidimicrobiaceae bacterium]
MTIKAFLVNCGNHAADQINVRGGELPGAGMTVMRGGAVELEAGRNYIFRETHHGGDDTCRDHQPMAVMSEGPGADLVRTAFNPSGDGAEDRIKALAAALVNEIDALPVDPADGGRVARPKAVAITNVQQASMWAVNAATAAAPPESG